MKDFFGLSKEVDGSYGYLRTAEGAWSWQHLLQVSIFIILMVALAIFFGKKYKNKTDKEKNKVLIWAALLIDGFELFKLIIFYTRSPEMSTIINNLPLF
jgi:membrane-associated HD superfamily phosphohydrolase